MHGEAGLAQAQKATAGLKPGADTVLDAETLEALAGDIPTAELALGDLVGKTVVDVMVWWCRLTPGSPRRYTDIGAAVYGYMVRFVQI